MNSLEHNIFLKTSINSKTKSFLYDEPFNLLNDKLNKIIIKMGQEQVSSQETSFVMIYDGKTYSTKPGFYHWECTTIEFLPKYAKEFNEIKDQLDTLHREFTIFTSLFKKILNACSTDVDLLSVISKNIPFNKFSNNRHILKSTQGPLSDSIQELIKKSPEQIDKCNKIINERIIINMLLKSI